MTQSSRQRPRRKPFRGGETSLNAESRRAQYGCKSRPKILSYPLAENQKGILSLLTAYSGGVVKRGRNRRRRHAKRKHSLQQWVSSLYPYGFDWYRPAADQPNLSHKSMVEYRHKTRPYTKQTYMYRVARHAARLRQAVAPGGRGGFWLPPRPGQVYGDWKPYPRTLEQLRKAELKYGEISEDRDRVWAGDRHVAGPRRIARRPRLWRSLPARDRQVVNRGRSEPGEIPRQKVVSSVLKTLQFEGRLPKVRRRHLWRVRKLRLLTEGCSPRKTLRLLSNLAGAYDVEEILAMARSGSRSVPTDRESEVSDLLYVRRRRGNQTRIFPGVEVTGEEGSKVLRLAIGQSRGVSKTPQRHPVEASGEDLASNPGQLPRRLGRKAVRRMRTLPRQGLEAPVRGLAHALTSPGDNGITAISGLQMGARWLRFGRASSDAIAFGGWLGGLLAVGALTERRRVRYHWTRRDLSS